MASLALGVAGAAAGFALGGPLGASIGWTLGSAAGNLLFPEKVQGPRLSDLRLHISSYGQISPKMWGTMRLAGNVIDGKDKFDEHEEKSGGKGGPEVTNYTYSYSFAVRLCERVASRDAAIRGIKRVWGNGRTLDLNDLPMTVYFGTEEQLPDPTLETIHGVGNVSAYRSIAYVVFTDLPLAAYGNALPNFEFECYTDADLIPIRLSTFDPTAAAYGNVVSGVTSDGTTITIASYRPDNKTYHVRHFLYDGTAVGINIDAGIPGAPSPDAVVANADLMIGNINADYFWWAGNVQGVLIDPASVPGWPPSFSVGIYQNGQVYVPYTDGYVNQGIMSFFAPNGTSVGTPSGSAFISGNAGSFTLNGSDNGRIYVTVDNGNSTVTVYEFDEALNAMHNWYSATDFPSDGGVLTYRGGGFLRYNDFFVTNFASSTQFRMNLLAISPTNVITNYTQPRDVNGVPDFQTTNWVQIVDLGNGYVLGRDGISLLLAPPNNVLLSTIVSDISQECGLSPYEVDVTDLTDTVDGYIVAQQATGREWIQPLRDRWTFDAFEGDAITFIKRGKAAIVTIPDGELAGHIQGEDSPPILGTVRIDELSLPVTVNVSFVDASADYQTNTQYARTQTTFSTSEVTLNLPINMTPSSGKAAAETQLWEARNERDRFTFQTSSKYLRYTPTDVINAHGLYIRIVDKTETHPGVLQWTGVYSRPQAFAHSGASVSRLAFSASPPTVVSLATTTAYPLDLPLVSDVDAPNGFYAAMSGSAGWPGAALFKSADGELTYASIVTTTVRAVMGTASGVLGPFYGGNMFDEGNFVTVVTTGGELDNATETAVLNGANEAAIGSEVVQFKNAELVGVNTYELSGLLRGRLGTEWAIGGHATGEHFTLLPVLRAPLGFSELNLSRQYKPVTLGATVAGTTAQAFTNTGASIKPYSPVLLGGGTDASGNVTLNWTRRTRIGGAWVPFNDVPLSEASESYVVQIWNSTYTNCARVISGITSPTTTYSSANQVTDFGANQQTIYFTVGQVGLSGLGFQSRGTAVGAGGSNSSVVAPIAPYQSPTSGSSMPPSSAVKGTIVIPWSPTGTRKYTTSVGSFACGDVIAFKFTTGAITVNNVIGRISGAEWNSGGPTMRTACLSTSAGDFSGAALAANSLIRGQNSITVFFSVGTNTSNYCQLSPNTDYYLNVKNDDGFGICTCFSSDCNMFMDLYKPTGT